MSEQPATYEIEELKIVKSSVEPEPEFPERWTKALEFVKRARKESDAQAYFADEVALLIHLTGDGW